MEFLCEIIFEVILEGIFGVTVENPKVKTWVKTGIVIFMDLLVLSFFAFIAGAGFQNRNWLAFSVGVILFLGWAVFSVRTTRKRHKENWKMPNSRR